MVARDEDRRRIVQCQNGDHGAFEALIKEHQRMIHSLCYRMSGSLADAEDLAQETFIHAYRHLDGFRSEARFSSWLYRIAVNLCLNWQKRRHRLNQLHKQWSQQDLEPTGADCGLAQQIQEALLTLPPKQRAALILTTYDGLTHAEAAAALVEAKRHASTRLPEIAFDERDKVHLAFAYLRLQSWREALSVLENLGDTSIVTQSDGPWGAAFTPVVPARQAALCREKLGLPPLVKAGRFTMEKPSVCLHSPSTFAASPDSLWVAIDAELIQLGFDLHTNKVVRLPISGYSGITSLCLGSDQFWIGTAGEGLVEYDKRRGECRLMTEKDGLLLNNISSLCLQNKTLWIGFGRQRELWLIVSGRGLCRYRAAQNLWDTCSFENGVRPQCLGVKGENLIGGFSDSHLRRSHDGHWERFGDGAALPERPTVLLLDGSDLWIGGCGYIVAFNLNQNRIRASCNVAARSIDRLQVAGGHVWAQFDGHLYRARLP